jgi:uncharacterized protein (TIGR03545 family)
MIRWRFVITRLVIVLVVIALLGWGLAPVAKYVTVRALESVTGAKVEIAATSIQLFPPRIHHQGLAIADPRSGKEMRDWIRADTIDFAIDGDALLHRRWVASNGRISGLQIGSQRQTSGHYEPQDDGEPLSASDTPSVLSRLLSSAADAGGDQADAIINESETVRRSKEIREQWEKEYDSLVVRARKLETQIRTVRDEARGIENPLRDWPMMEKTLAQARQARSELMNVRQAIDALPDRLQADLARLDEAKQIDLAKIDQYVPGDLSQSSDFGIDVLTQAVRDQVQQIRGYLDSGRELAGYTVVAPESERQRGVDFELDPVARPQLTIRRCQIDGLLRSGGDTYTMTGIVENLTPTPQLLVEPTRARLRLEGPEILRVEFIRDRRRGSDVDMLTLHWPQTEAKSLRLGNEHDAGISIDGGQRELWVQVQSQGERLKGRLVSKQTGVAMNLSLDPKYANTPAAKSLQSSLATVDRIEIDANFDGTWSDLDLNLNTNLGQIFRRATQEAIDGQIRASREQLAARVQQVHLENSLELRQWLGSQQSEARSLLASADKSIEEMSQKVMNEMGDADAYLGKLRSAIRGPLR